MNIANLSQPSNGTMRQAFVMDSWADLYDFTSGIFRAQLRERPNSPIVLYEWNTNTGGLSYDGRPATGWFYYTSNPVISDTLVLGGTVVTYVDVGVVAGINQVNVGTNLAGTISNLITWLNSPSGGQLNDLSIALCTFTAFSNGISVTYNTGGLAGNSWALMVNSAGSVTSGDTLTGAGGLLTMTAPVNDIAYFNGDYYYDCRFETNDGQQKVPIFGGIITFVEGITRDTASIPEP
jgi:hypothetical protein